MITNGELLYELYNTASNDPFILTFILIIITPECKETSRTILINISLPFRKV